MFHMHAGLDSQKAARLYRRAERRLQVAQPPPERQQTYVQAYLTAGEAAGIPTDDEPLSRSEPPEDGLWVNALAVGGRGRRQDACAAYLMPLLREGRECAGRVEIVQSATVSQVVLKGGRAVGVRYLDAEREEHSVTAAVEVVLSAGPFGSPKVLQLSGVGPPAVLDDLGIDVVVDLPVGQNTLVRPPSACHKLMHADTCGSRPATILDAAVCNRARPFSDSDIIAQKPQNAQNSMK